jgi:hypothetical protein
MGIMGNVGRRLGYLVVALAMTIAIPAGPAASATPAWSIVASPNPPAAPSGSLDGMTCPTSTDCFAVGYTYTTDGDSRPAAERWNGTTWSVLAVPSPAGASNAVLANVACTSASSCIAVGVADSAALMESWNGTTWTIVSLPMPGGATTSRLGGVACSGASDCTVVGSYGTGVNSPSTLVEHWNGSSWQVVASPSPSGVDRVELTDIKCPSASNCVAVGFTQLQVGLDTTSATFAERWNGSTWAIVATPNFPSASSSTLGGITCLFATTCLAVGWGDTAAPGATPARQTLLERWNGTAWSIMSSPNVAGADSSSLERITCVNDESCFAVGASLTGNTSKALVERWNGVSWAVAPDAALGHAGSSLTGVACASASQCFAGGLLGSLNIIESWNPSSWVFAAAPSASSQSQLSGLACTSNSSCIAVGSKGTVTGATPLVERWNGTVWSVMTTPTPAAPTSGLTGIACPTATSCVAVGYAQTSTGYRTLAERWNGTAWSLIATPNPVGAYRSFLQGVSCLTATNCFAVGNSGPANGSSSKPLVEHWNGTAWSIMTSPATTGDTHTALKGVACSSTTQCFAVGSASTTKPLVERWNGTAWAIVATPAIAATTSTTLTSVSCATAASCSAVGSYFAGANRTLVERWNGTAWSRVASPNPAGATNPLLNSVSCKAVTNCWAVGQSVTGSTTKTLVERWNGTAWAIVASPNKAGSSRSVLSGVTCTSATRCQAAGSYNTLGRSYTLTERYL